MISFQMVQKVKVVVGSNSLSVLGELLADNGKKKVLFVCDEGIKNAGILQTAIDSVEKMGIEYAVYSNVQADPPAYLADEGIALYRHENCDSVVGIGGGSSMDTAKAINILVYNEGPIIKYAAPDANMNPAGGLILVPTTAGTGSELSDGLVITSDNIKYPILADKATAEYAILDPMTMVALPAHITASTGMDTLSHAAEAYTSTAATTFSDMISEKIMESVAKWLPAAIADGNNIEARENLCVAACLGGWMLQHAHSNAGHSIAHILGGRFHIPHGFACAYSLPEVLRYNAAAMPEKTRWIGELFGAKIDADDSAEAIGEKARAAVIRFRDEVVGLKAAKDFAQNISEDTFEAAAQETAAELFQMFNPVKMDAAQAKKILKDIFA